MLELTSEKYFFGYQISSLRKSLHSEVSEQFIFAA